MFQGILNILACWENCSCHLLYASRLSRAEKVLLVVWASEPEAGTSLSAALFL